MQKILFYQKQKPKTADGLWMHKDADGNMKLDYVSNGRVKPLGYMNSEAGSGGGSTSDGYKPYLKINPSSEYQTAGRNGLIFTSATDAAQSLGISEQDFLKLCSSQMPMLVAIDYSEVVLSLKAYAEEFEAVDASYVIGDFEYGSISDGYQYSLFIRVSKESSEADDSTKEYHVALLVEVVEGSEEGGGPK